MKKIDKVEGISINFRRTLILAKLGITLLIISMIFNYHSLLFAIAENNIYAIVLCSSILCFQVFVWIWNIFL
jgi:hypothetical protein